MLLFLDVLTTAAILFIVSIGLLAIFGVLKIINFAHGAWLTIGAYCAVVAVKLGLNPWAGLPIAFVAGALFGGESDVSIATLSKRPPPVSPPESPRAVITPCSRASFRILGGVAAKSVSP